VSFLSLRRLYCSLRHRALSLSFGQLTHSFTRLISFLSFSHSLNHFFSDDLLFSINAFIGKLWFRHFIRLLAIILCVRRRYTHTSFRLLECLSIAISLTRSPTLSLTLFHSICVKFPSLSLPFKWFIISLFVCSSFPSSLQSMKNILFFFFCLFIICRIRRSFSTFIFFYHFS